MMGIGVSNRFGQPLGSSGVSPHQLENKAHRSDIKPRAESFRPTRLVSLATSRQSSHQRFQPVCKLARQPQHSSRENRGITQIF